MSLNHKLVLGTVQFGLPYGINNQKGQTPKAEVFKILSAAQRNNVSTLDTAPAYGEALKVLAEYMSIGNSFQLISKFHGNNRKAIFESVEMQLKTLQQPSIDYLLFHSFKDWVENPSSIKDLFELKEKGLIKFLGISLYTNEELEKAIDSGCFDVVQVPFNLLDNFSKKGFLFEKAKQRGIKIHVRSVFLQGLFFREQSSLPAFFSPITKSLSEIHSICKRENIKIADLAIQYAVRNEYIDKVLIGVDSEKQFLENIESLNSNIDSKIFKKVDALRVSDLRVLNPVFWPQ